MPLRWRKLENFKLELPRDTLLSVEIVQELKGEVRGRIKKMKVIKYESWNHQNHFCFFFLNGEIITVRDTCEQVGYVQLMVMIVQVQIQCICSSGQSSAKNQCSSCNGCTNTKWHRCKRSALQPTVRQCSHHFYQMLY